MSLRIKYIFCSRKKSDVLFNNYFYLSHNFQAWFYNADHLLYYPQMSVFPFHTFFVLLYKSVTKKWNVETMLKFPYSDNFQKLKTTKWMKKRSHEYQSMDPEYLTEQINSRILELLWDDFVIWFLHRLRNLNML